MEQDGKSQEEVIMLSLKGNVCFFFWEWITSFHEMLLMENMCVLFMLLAWPESLGK
jgi:hypothetical protein